EVTLNVEKGEFVAIMGPSGSGKSTLMNIIGLLDRPTNGNYSLGGRSVARLKAGRQAKIRRDKIGFVFQYYNLLPRLTALENVALPLAYRGVSLGRRLKQASLMLDEVGLQDREYYMPGQLSGGQIQRVAIARALLTNPDIIIADEPTGNLDSASSLLVMELLSEIHRNGRTVLMVTHNPELTRYANRIVYMQDGVVIHDELSQVGRVPARARRLIYSLPKTTEDDDIAGVSALMTALPGQKSGNGNVSGSGKHGRVGKGRGVKKSRRSTATNKKTARGKAKKTAVKS
ncbi:MAG: ABC transporter ATP-binding protein, partial [Candidatus Saccharimonadales bacterium]